MRTYDYEHVVGFEETNLVGNVYFVNHLRWQGRCRESFLRDNAPDVVAEIQDGLALATTRCACEYFQELWAFDRLKIRMSLGHMIQNRVEMVFAYWRQRDDGTEELVAEGKQEIACMRRTGDATVPTPIPEQLRRALLKYQQDPTTKATDTITARAS
jgi:enediyne biosynthesis thioesterase